VSSPFLRRLCCVAGVLVFGGCATHVTVPPPAPDARPMLVHLEQDDVRAVAALLRMEDARTWDGPLIERLLRDETAEVRGRAALAAARLRDRRAAPLLLRALQDPDAGVRSRAAFGLGLLADTTAETIAALSAAAFGGEVRAATEAAAALGRTATERARPALDSLLLAPALPAEVLHEALLAAWRLPRSRSTTHALVQRAAHPDAEVRWRAVYSLARVPSPDAAPAFLAAASDPDPRVRAQAVRGLRAAVADSAGRRAASLEALVAAVDDPHPHVRINALRNLPAYGGNRTLALLVSRLREDDANVAVAAAQALGEAADPAASEALRDVATNPSKPDALRTAALAAWMRADPTGAVPAAAAWTDSARWLVRYHGARALGAAPWRAAAPVLERLSRDTNPVVAAEALNAIVAAVTAPAAGESSPAPAARRVFVERLGAADPLVRAAAARGLGRDGGVTDMDLLLEAFEAARRDVPRDARIAIVEALGRLVAMDVPVARAFYLRFGDRAPPDPALHRAMAQHIGPPPASWGEPRVAPEPRPLGFYEDVVRSLVAPVLAGAEPPSVAISTTHGDIVLELAAADAPLTVLNFLGLVERGYYDGTRWHRVVPNFVIQDGDPRGDGSGGPGYAIRDEINERRYLRGTLGMALAGPDTGGSQFFITHSPQPHLDGGYTIFGRVASGLDAVDAVVQEEPLLGVRRIR
jgi:cyclophilin family peptidyl-prolyl cis-trans isomerase/HEAT repeat protein